MNEKKNRLFSWLAGVGAFLLAIFIGKRKRDLNGKRISNAQDNVADGRRTVGEIADRNQRVEECADAISDGLREASDSAERAGQTVGNARDAIRRSLDILEQAEKRTENK